MKTRANIENQNRIRQNSKNDFNLLLKKIENKIPFTFTRFSDGEMEIIRNRKLIIKEGEVIWNKGISKHSYPVFDFKTFDPNINFELRNDLIKSAEYSSATYVKGIPTSHNDALEDRNLMIELNGNSCFNLTFADLFLNQNFIKFRKLVIPKLHLFKNMYYVGNFRAKPKNFLNSCTHVKVVDNFFIDYENNRKKTFEMLINVPPFSLVLLSASSLSNILGHNLMLQRSDLTVIDVGTSMHDLVGLQSGIREYHTMILAGDLKSTIKKIRYKSRKGYKLKW